MTRRNVERLLMIETLKHETALAILDLIAQAREKSGLTKAAADEFETAILELVTEEDA